MKRVIEYDARWPVNQLDSHVYDDSGVWTTRPVEMEVGESGRRQKDRIFKGSVIPEKWDVVGMEG